MRTWLHADSQPRMAPGFRLHWEIRARSFVLLYPEGLVTLDDRDARILERCDGSRSAADIVGEIRARYPAAETEGQVLTFLVRARAAGWIVAA